MFDHIPGGKKQVRDPKTGEWSLVDVNTDNKDDLKALLEEERGKVSCLETEIESLQEQMERMQDVVVGGNKAQKEKLKAILKLDEKSFEKLLKK